MKKIFFNKCIFLQYFTFVAKLKEHNTSLFEQYEKFNNLWPFLFKIVFFKAIYLTHFLKLEYNMVIIRILVCKVTTVEESNPITFKM